MVTSYDTDIHIANTAGKVVFGRATPIAMDTRAVDRSSVFVFAFFLLEFEVHAQLPKGHYKYYSSGYGLREVRASPVSLS